MRKVGNAVVEYRGPCGIERGPRGATRIQQTLKVSGDGGEQSTAIMNTERHGFLRYLRSAVDQTVEQRDSEAVDSLRIHGHAVALVARFHFAAFLPESLASPA